MKAGSELQNSQHLHLEDIRKTLRRRFHFAFFLAFLINFVEILFRTNDSKE